MNILEIKSLFKTLLQDKVIAGMMLTMIILAAILSVYVVTSIQASSAQVVVRYTGFGDTHYYRNHWTYLFSFGGLGLFILIFNAFISVKLLSLQKRPLAFAWLIASLGLIVIVAILAHSVIGVKYL